MIDIQWHIINIKVYKERHLIQLGWWFHASTQMTMKKNEIQTERTREKRWLKLWSGWLFAISGWRGSITQFCWNELLQTDWLNENSKSENQIYIYTSEQSIREGKNGAALFRRSDEVKHFSHTFQPSTISSIYFIVLWSSWEHKNRAKRMV